ncbi:MAG TPA: hydrogenase maturation protease [candidate division Zixibacteria bacterium]|nr:hydrogenase maturation protease [candidate division Zixibacteria bacterium]
MPKILVIGVGSEYGSDDRVGLVVARRLKELVPPGVELIEHTGDGTALVSAWNNTDLIFLIDATSSGAEPGTIYRIDGLSTLLPAEISTSSTHSFGLREAIKLARLLDQLPGSLLIFGIEGGSFSFGSKLSSEVEAAAESVVEQILNEIGIA